MEQAEKLRNLIIELIKSYPGAAYPIHEIDMVISQAFEQVAKEVAIEFGTSIFQPYSTDYRDIIRDRCEKLFDEFTNKAQHCSECGKPMEQKEIIIKGDIDTCDECLCPE